jgi:hypothetical protein
LKLLPVRDPGTAIIRKVPGKDKLSLALQIQRFTGRRAWVEHGIVNMEHPGPFMELVQINGVVIFKQQPARDFSNRNPKG